MVLQLLHSTAPYRIVLYFRGWSHILSVVKGGGGVGGGGGVWKMLTLNDKRGRGVRQMLTLAGKGGMVGLDNADIADKKL